MRNGAEVPHTAREVALKPGDVVRVQTNAGGGYGNPFEREPELVLNDVLNRYVTLAGAQRDYVVVIDPINRVVDVAATEKLRAARTA